jgi:hypothetical protein
MQQFTVPQFIDVENQIIGPITTRQFIILIIGAVIIAIFYKLFTFDLFIVVSSLIFIVDVVFAFVKINGQPFHLFGLNVFQTFKRPSIRVWNNRLAVPVNEDKIPTIKFDATRSSKEYYQKSHLAELSLIVDTKGEYRGDEANEEIVGFANDLVADNSDFHL